MSSIEKMLTADISGPESLLDTALGLISDSGCFHMENAALRRGQNGKSAKRENPYITPIKQLSEIAALTGITYERAEHKLRDSDLPGVCEEISTIRDRATELSADVQAEESKLASHTSALEQIGHLSGGGERQALDVDFQEVFSCSNIRVRYGRMPVDSYERLPYYDESELCFITYGSDNSYCYGFALSPSDGKERMNEILADLYFERIHIPDFIHGSIGQATEEMKRSIENDKAEIEKKRKALGEYMSGVRDKLCRYFTKLKVMYDTFELRENVLIAGGKFYITGYVPKRDEETLRKSFDGTQIDFAAKELSKKEEADAPVKLRTSRFAEPFSMFVELYGLPGYKDINPTSFLAITYTLLFGIMFGDLGQGFLLVILGFILHKKNGSTLGRIMKRLGVSSMIFGTLYGSVFGFEELLDPVYERLGIHFLPFKTISNINTVLYAAIGIGIVIIIISVLINMFMGFRTKDYTRALFSNSGLAGLVFYCALLFLLLGGMLGIKAGGPAYIICLIVLPLVVMFLKEPLGELVQGRGFAIHESVGDFIASNFFECFEYLLGYATNTLSFVRVGGFVLSHAGMMSVVLALSSMAGNMLPVVMVLGNLFVMALEGLLSGIQVLRLEFYEMFSRYYTGGGKPFTPVRVNFDEIIE